MPSRVPKGLRVDNFVLCEEVRAELGGKYTLLGVMPGDFNVAFVPGVVKVTFYVEFYLDVEGAVALPLIVKFNGVPMARIDGSIDVNSPKDVIVIPLPSFPLTITGPGELTVDMEYAGTTYRALSRQVRIVPPPEASGPTSSAPSPPSARSPTFRKKKARKP